MGATQAARKGKPHCRHEQRTVTQRGQFQATERKSENGQVQSPKRVPVKVKHSCHHQAMDPAERSKVQKLKHICDFVSTNLVDSSSANFFFFTLVTNHQLSILFLVGVAGSGGGGEGRRAMESGGLREGGAFNIPGPSMTFSKKQFQNQKFL